MILVVALTTWCWAQNLGEAKTCVYSEQSCHGVMKLRGGICAPASDTRFWRNRQSSDRTAVTALWSSWPGNDATIESQLDVGL